VLTHKFVAFGAEQHRISSGKSIALLEMYLTQSRFKDYLANQMNSNHLRPDIIVLDAPDQADLSPIARQAAADARNACGVRSNCLTFIAPWTAGEKLEAAKIVFANLTSD
jgi:hypothetical protein